VKQSTYLYGRKFDAKELVKMTYTDALSYKVQCAMGLVCSLTEATTMSTDWNRINQVHRAIRFNESLLAEAKGKDLDV